MKGAKGAKVHSVENADPKLTGTRFFETAEGAVRVSYNGYSTMVWCDYDPGFWLVELFGRRCDYVEDTGLTNDGRVKVMMSWKTVSGDEAMLRILYDTIAMM